MQFTTIMRYHDIVAFLDQGNKLRRDIEEGVE